MYMYEANGGCLTEENNCVKILLQITLNQRRCIYGKMSFLNQYPTNLEPVFCHLGLGTNLSMVMISYFRKNNGRFIDLAMIN